MTHPRRPPRRARRGRAFTLIETLIFFAIVTILLGTAWKILLGGTHIGRTAVEGLALQQGIRNLVENVVRDVNAAFLINEPHAESDLPTGGATPSSPRRLVLYMHQRLAGPQPNAPIERLQAPGNPEGPYPFGKTQSQNEYSLPAFAVVYEWDPAKRTVSRAVLPGFLVCASTEERPGLVDSYTFLTGGNSELLANARQPKKILAREVEDFAAYPFTYDHSKTDPETRLPKVVLSKDLEGSGQRIDQTVGVVLRVKAAYRSEEPVKAAQDNSMEVLTKIWSYPKLYDHRYRAFFSSVDGDLRY